MESVDAAAVIEAISNKTGKGREEVKKMIQSKKEKFSGLLTDSGAAFMVAKELGLDLSIEKTALQHLKISQLREGMNNVDLIARVMQVFSPREFEKGGKKGRLCNLIIADDSGEIRLTVWNNDVSKLDEISIGRGSTIILNGCYVSSYNERLQLNLGFNGSITESTAETEKIRLPKVEATVLKLNKLKEDMNDVSVVARVLRIFPVNRFEKTGFAAKKPGPGRVVNFEIGDETSVVRATAWNDLVDWAVKLRENDVMKIEGGYTKKGLNNAVELHLGWRARIIADPAGVELPKAEEIRKEEVKEAKISGLKDGMKELAQIQAAVVDVNPSQFCFNVCPECSGKLEKLAGGFVCGKCGEVKEPGINAVLSLKLDDGSGSVNAVFYRQNALSLMGLDNEQLKKKIKLVGAGPFREELREKLAEKKIKVKGSCRINAFSNELEITARSFEKD